MSGDLDPNSREFIQATFDVAQHEINWLNREIGDLMRRRGEQEEIVRRARLRLAGIEPCRACGRAVESPCHDRDGYQEAGPWDGSCRGVLYPERER